ncbi:MAG: hypothetical protein ACFFER_15995 [Candidatus Thorarchaeota archaeon]
MIGMNIDSLVKKQIAIINIGSSTDRGIPGPIFADGRFVFVPIRESRPGKNTPTYEELGLRKWVTNPKEYAHYDPEFETMTYGDYAYKTRVANARKLKHGDFLFFFASLSNQTEKKIRRPTGFFFIGFFEIDRILPPEIAVSSPLYRKNAHVIRKGDSGFSIWKGTRRSALLEKAVLMDRRSVDSILRTSKGEILPWGTKDKNGRVRTDLEVINSATRTSRIILPNHRRALWKMIKESNPNLTIFDT